MYRIYRLLHLWRYIAKYVYKSRLNIRWISLPVLYSRPFASKALFWVILKDSELAVSVFLLNNRRTREESLFWRAPAQERFSPGKSYRSLSNFAAKRSKDSRFSSYLPIENPSKRSGASHQRKVKSHSFERSKCVARFIRASQKPSHWLPLFDWMSLNRWFNNDWFKEDLVSVYCLTTSNQKETISGMVSGWHVWILLSILGFYVFWMDFRQYTAGKVIQRLFNSDIYTYLAIYRYRWSQR